MTIDNRWLVIIVVGSAAAIACGRGSSAGRADSAAGQSAPTTASDTTATVRGTVVSLSATTLVIKADTGSVTVQVTPPLQVYDREPGRLADVKDNSFIGVTTVKQSDGSERAAEIHIFPEELRGLGEGSRMMTADRAAGPSRMTNGTASQSRMSNGNVSSTNGSSLVVQYAGGSQNVTVPPNTPVTELQLSSKNLAVGDQIAVLVTKAPDGSLTADRAISTAK